MKTAHNISNRFPLGLDPKAERKFSRLFAEIEAFAPVSMEAAEALAADECCDLEPANASFDGIVDSRGLPTESVDGGFDFDGDRLVVTTAGNFWMR